MLNKPAVLLGACLLVAVTAAPYAVADPPADPPVQPVANAAPRRRLVPSRSRLRHRSPRRSRARSPPRRWVLTVTATKVHGARRLAHQLAVVAGIPRRRQLRGHGDRQGKTKLSGGTLEPATRSAAASPEDDIESISSATGIAGIGLPFATGSIFPLVLGAQIGEQGKIDLKPGTVNVVPVDKKKFKGTRRTSASRLPD